MTNICFLTHDDVRRCEAVSVAGAVEAMRKVFTCHYNNDYILPHKVVLRWGDIATEATRGRINAMPAFIGGDFEALAFKWIGSFPSNRGMGLPRATAVIVLNDARTGLPLCIMEGSYISAMRTAATNLLAAEFLCKPDSREIAIIGTGVQNRFQLKGFLSKFPSIERVKIFNRSRERAEHFRSLFSESRVEMQISDSVAEAVKDADIVVSATTSNEPLIKGGELKQGVTYFHFSGHECEYAVIDEFDKIFVDDWDVILHRGNLTPALMYQLRLLDDSRITGNLGELVVSKMAGRESTESIIFCAMGMAIEDAAVAKEVFIEAKARGLGHELPLWIELDPMISEVSSVELVGI